ncbi:DNA polymerase III subunit delta [Candidatus Uhrbacteria bacterium]|nr:DNA polymerase III subunit delta [Candidatus Uhrbacteria bacterium]
MIFFLYGQDTYRSRQKLKELKEKFVRDVDPSGANLVVLHGDTMKPEDFRSAVSAMSMFVKKRMVVVERLLESGKQSVQEAVAEYLTHKDFPEDHIVVFWEPEGGKSKVRKVKKSVKSKVKSLKSKVDGEEIAPLLDVLKKQKYVQEFAPLTPLEVERWITDEVQKRGGKIAERAVHLLASAVGNDLWRLANEIGKLVAGDASITEAAVREEVLAKTESAIFAFTDALGSRHREEALRLLTNERASGMEPLQLLAMMIRQFRILLRLSQNDTEGINPYVVGKTQSQVRNFSFDELKNIYRRLLEIDVLLKTTRVNPDALLVLFVTDITTSRA